MRKTDAIMHRMNDWDDLRFFLAIARKGSIRAAADELSVNHSTVSRRISAFEKKLGVRLFDRLPSGYALTPVGEEMIASAERVEDEVLRLNRQITGRDTQLSGVLRVTMPGPLATHLLMPDLAAFSKTYPGIKLELAISYEEFNLKKREADIAIRVTESPPDYLIGRRVAHAYKAVYASHEYLRRHDVDKQPESVSWMGWEDTEAFPEWAKGTRFANAPVFHQSDDPYVQLEAVRQGMGIAILPCMMGDQEPDLQRLDLVVTNDTSCGDIWMLTHKDLRGTARVRKFFDFMNEAFERHRDLLEGRCPQQASPAKIAV